MPTNSLPQLTSRGRWRAGAFAASILVLACLLPRRTQSYLPAAVPRPGEKPAAVAPLDIPLPDGVETFVNRVGIRMIRVPAGRFVMGSPRDEKHRRDDESQHAVEVSKPFWISQTEVTQAQWRAVMLSNRSRFVGDDLPVTGMNWADAQDFCDTLTVTEGVKYRLPTEIEWEYACRAGTETAFATGDALRSDQARFAADETFPAGPRPVGSFPPNAWGIRDMHGNVAEWMYRLYHPSNGPTLKSEDEAYFLHTLDFSIRGGSWCSPEQHCRSARRDHAHMSNVGDDIGFRVVAETE